MRKYYQQHHKSDNDDHLFVRKCYWNPRKRRCVSIATSRRCRCLGCNIFCNSEQNLSQNFQNRLDSRGLGDPVFSDNVNNSVII